MRKAKIKLFCFLIISLFVNSCGTGNKTDVAKESLFNQIVEGCSMNSEIVFQPLQPNYDFGDDINLSYKNVSQERILFAPDLGVKILMYEEKNLLWTEVKNNMSYSSSPSPFVITEPGNDLSSYGMVLISPNLSESEYEIRVVITGHIYRNNEVTPLCVGAFIDIEQ